MTEATSDSGKPPSGPIEALWNIIWVRLLGRFPQSIRVVVLMALCCTIGFFSLSTTTQDNAISFLRVVSRRYWPISSKDKEEAARHSKQAEAYWSSMTYSSDRDKFHQFATSSFAEYVIAEGLNPSSSYYAVGAGASLNRVGRYAEAAIKLRIGIALEFGYAPAWYYNEYCVALRNIKQLDQAETACSEAVKRDHQYACYQEELIKTIQMSSQMDSAGAPPPTCSPPKQP